MDGFSASTYLAKLLPALALVVALFLLLAWLMRRTRGFSAASRSGLRLVGGMNLGARERLLVVEVGKEQLLLAVCAGRIEKLHVLHSPLDEAADDAAATGRAGQTGDFGQSLRALMSQRGARS